MKAKDELIRIATMLGTGELSANEPLFVLRARDYYAAKAVWYWICSCKEDGRVPEEKMREAERLHALMLEWPGKHIPGTDEPWSEPTDVTAASSHV